MTRCMPRSAWERRETRIFSPHLEPFSHISPRKSYHLTFSKPFIVRCSIGTFEPLTLWMMSILFTRTRLRTWKHISNTPERNIDHFSSGEIGPEIACHRSHTVIEFETETDLTRNDFGSVRRVNPKSFSRLHVLFWRVRISRSLLSCSIRSDWMRCDSTVSVGIARNVSSRCNDTQSVWHCRNDTERCFIDSTAPTRTSRNAIWQEADLLPHALLSFTYDDDTSELYEDKVYVYPRTLEEAVRLGGESVIPDPYYVSTVALMYSNRRRMVSQIDIDTKWQCVWRRKISQTGRLDRYVQRRGSESRDHGSSGEDDYHCTFRLVLGERRFTISYAVLTLLSYNIHSDQSYKRVETKNSSSTKIYFVSISVVEQHCTSHDTLNLVRPHLKNSKFSKISSV